MSTSESKPKLPTTFPIRVNGEVREVFMSYALLNRLAYLVGNPDHVPLIECDPETRDVVLVELLSERSKTGKIKERIELDMIEVDLDEIQALLNWAAESVLNFTLGAIENSKALQLKHQARVLRLMSSPIGLETSASKTPAA